MQLWHIWPAYDFDVVGKKVERLVQTTEHIVDVYEEQHGTKHRTLEHPAASFGRP
ncbi:unnamed protein product [Echinostoma caproni]|uniref:Uncharacterized protein n=1 Tax=Echinostoma caproni TaxID=27848 RepID=A0A3P8HS27_9TREM|nr:unnamed protein product [Echinostoma caproni]